MKSKVYFTKNITKEAILKMYQVLEKDLKGKVAVKVHSGEAGNQNYLRPEMYEDVIKHLNGTLSISSLPERCKSFTENAKKRVRYCDAFMNYFANLELLLLPCQYLFLLA